MIMPPGWSHTGEHKTARAVKQKLKEEEEQSRLYIKTTPIIEQTEVK